MRITAETVKSVRAKHEKLNSQITSAPESMTEDAYKALMKRFLTLEDALREFDASMR